MKPRMNGRKLRRLREKLKKKIRNKLRKVKVVEWFGGGKAKPRTEK